MARILIIGAGEAGRMVRREIDAHPELALEVRAPAMAHTIGEPIHELSKQGVA